MADRRLQKRRTKRELAAALNDPKIDDEAKAAEEEGSVKLPTKDEEAPQASQQADEGDSKEEESEAASHDELEAQRSKKQGGRTRGSRRKMSTAPAEQRNKPKKGSAMSENALDRKLGVSI